MVTKSLWIIAASLLFAAGVAFGTSLIVGAQPPSPTPRAPRIGAPTATLMPTAAPTATPIIVGDAERGLTVFTTAHNAAPACANCHHIDAADASRLVGPNLAGIGERAAAYAAAGTIDGVNISSAQGYLYDSIAQPGAFVVPDYPNVMYPHYARWLSGEEIDDLVAYLLTL
jgi:cytochrome c2